MKLEIELKEVKDMECVGFTISDFVINVNEGKGEIREQIGGQTIFTIFNGKKYMLDLKEVFKKIELLSQITGSTKEEK